MRLYLLFAVFFLALMPFARAEVSEGPLVKIRLLPEKNVVAPGDEIWVAIEKSIAPHWHTYWKNPGDSGLPLRVEWSSPDGFEMDEIRWPVPEKIPYEPLMNFGYEGSVMLLQQLKVPDDLPDGALEFKATIEVLVCKEECIPEYGEYSFTLNGSEQMPEDNTAYLNSAREALPVATDWNVEFAEQDGDFVLAFDVPEAFKYDEIEFFPDEWGLIDNPALLDVSYGEGGLVLKQKRGDRDLAELEGGVHGLLVVKKDGVRTGYRFAAKASEVTAQAPDEQVAVERTSSSDFGLMSALLFALLGGMILNLMPCVFPVLSLKALSLVKISEESPVKARMHGLSYTLGVVLSFLVIAGGLIALKAGGASIGWGFQLQNPVIVGALAYLLFVIGLNLSGFFEFANPFGNVGGGLASKEGLSGSFFTGILATLVATPCTAPFMAGAIGYALVQPAYVSLIIFAALGLGLALPYLALSVFPPLQKMLPKPGAWMDVFKQFLAFPMFGAAVWLVWVIGMQTGGNGAAGLLAGMVFIAFAIWCFQHKPADRFWRGFVVFFACFSLFASVLVMPKHNVPSAAVVQGEKAFGETFTHGKLDEILKGSEPVFVEMTAAWCITCKINHGAAINVDSTRDLFAAKGVRFLVGDWTNEDPEITKYLEKYGRSGVPLYVYYASPGEDGVRPQPKVLPQVLTPGIVRSFVEGS